LLYNARGNRIPLKEYDYPFNGDGKFKPVLGLEIGHLVYMYGQFMNSFPLNIVGSGVEFGIGGKIAGKHDQRFYYVIAPGIGYRGEFIIYHNCGLSIGFLILASENRNIYTTNIGLIASL
jgi:hypothetical protein